VTKRQPFKLDQLGTVARGKSRHRPRNDPALYGGKWPFFQTGDVKEANLYLRHYAQTYNDVGLAQSKLWPVGTLCITIAANIAETAILAIPGCFPDSIVGFIPDPKKSDARFIKYFIETLKIGMQNASKGTTQDNLSVDKLMTFDFAVPGVEEQRCIASVLSAYDDLIENNTRRIAIMEEMARRIYEEWFVRFRFPGHENVRMIESEMGLVPRDWVMVSIESITSTLARGPTLSYVDDGIPVLNQRCIRHGEINLEAIQKARPLAKAKEHLYLAPLDILINSMGVGTLGRVSRNVSVLDKMIVHNCITLVRASPARCSQAYLFYVLSGLQGEFESIAVGATGQTSLPITFLQKLVIKLPPSDLMLAFDKFVLPMWHQIGVLKRAIGNLRTTRDLLLPKLISGELDVSAMPEPEAAAA